jgi:hypothetical protein
MIIARANGDGNPIAMERIKTKIEASTEITI